MDSVCKSVVFSAFRRGVLFGHACHCVNGTIERNVFSAFRRGVLFGRNYAPTKQYANGLVFSAFRRGVLFGLPSGMRMQAASKPSLQCLSAWSPIRTYSMKNRPRHVRDLSSVPFGVESYSDQDREN